MLTGSVGIHVLYCVTSCFWVINKGGFSIEQDETATAYKNDLSVFAQNLVHAPLMPYRSGSTVITGAEMKTKAEANGCITYANAADIQLEAPFNLTAPNFLPKAGSPALTGAVYNGDLDAFFTTGTLPWCIWYH